jgi:hypothetical protein
MQRVYFVYIYYPHSKNYQTNKQDVIGDIKHNCSNHLLFLLILLHFNFLHLLLLFLVFICPFSTASVSSCPVLELLPFAPLHLVRLLFFSSSL